ncbi:MAG TPA: glycosyltransferase family 1 protein [bacterium]|nr:glycosyltransferase family 1 protein [bacterium]
MPLPIALDYRPALLSRAGIGRATRELARALGERDDLAVHLFGHSFARAAVPFEPHPAARLHRLPIPGRSLGWLRRFGVGADHLAGRARVFHWTDYVQPPVARARKVLTVHDLAFVRDAGWHGGQAGALRERTRAMVAAADALVVPSHATAADVRAFAPGHARLQVIPFGSDHVPTAPSAHPLAGRDYALCLGTIEPRKNHLGLLAAWRRLPVPRPLLVCVGARGWACEEIVTELAAAEREGLLRWLRRADDDLLWPLLQHARLMVYPSLWEGFGFPPLEAMALGVPVVANDCAPLRELGDGALVLTDARHVDALADALERAWRDASLRSEKIDHGRRRAAAFRWRDCAARHAALYREVAE